MKIPMIVQIELTNYCNSACKYCPHSKMKRKQEFMPIEQYKLIVDKCKKEGVTIISPFLNGESALHPDFMEAIKYTKEKGLTIYLFDNMSLIDKSRADLILELFGSEDMLVCSIDTINPGTYKVMRGLNFETVMKNTDYLINKYFNELKQFHLVVQQIRYEETKNPKEIEQFNNYFNKYRRFDGGEKFRVISGEAMNWGGQMKTSNTPTKDTCIRITRDMAILVNGDVCLCCLDYEGKYIFGNIFKQSIEEIYNSEKFNNIRNNFPTGMCKECDARWQS